MGVMGALESSAAAPGPHFQTCSKDRNWLGTTGPPWPHWHSFSPTHGSSLLVGGCETRQ